MQSSMEPNTCERRQDPRGAAMISDLISPPRDHIVWSLFNFFYMNAFCLGFVALYFSIKSRDRKVVADLEGAREYGSTARRLNIAALVLSLLFFIAIIILLSLNIIKVQKYVPGGY